MSAFALAATSPLIPTAAAMRKRPLLSSAGVYKVARSAPTRVKIPTSSPDALTTGATVRRCSCKKSKASRGLYESGITNGFLLITCETCVKRSTETQSSSVMMPTGLFPSTTTIAPCARLLIRLMASATVSAGAKVIAVSKNG